jgi:putative SOS response-associated peptidase YedK
MCGRFAITLPRDAVLHLFDAVPGSVAEMVPRLNVSPTQGVVAVVAGERGRELREMRWGFLPHWYKTPGDGPLLINARSETIAEKPAFRDAVRNRRCLIPASWFYEWKTPDGGRKEPWVIAPADGGSFAFAGIWQDWRPKGADPDAPTIPTCAIVTCPANTALAHVHERMPVIVPPGSFGLWLGEQGHGAATLMQPAADASVTAQPADADTRAILARRVA